MRAAGCGFFSVTDRYLLKRPKKLSQFGHNVRKGRPVNIVSLPVNIVSLSFDNITGQMIEMHQRKKARMALFALIFTDDKNRLFLETSCMNSMAVVILLLISLSYLFKV